MGKYNFYAVKRGRVVGIYRTWNDCKAQIKDYPGARFRGFENITDATNYLEWDAEQKERYISQAPKNYYPNAWQLDRAQAIKKIMNFSKTIKHE